MIRTRALFLWLRNRVCMVPFHHSVTASSSTVLAAPWGSNGSSTMAVSQCCPVTLPRVVVLYRMPPAVV